MSSEEFVRLWGVLGGDGGLGFFSFEISGHDQKMNID